jgi:EpsI family protein
MPAPAAESCETPGAVVRGGWRTPAVLSAIFLAIALIYWPSTRSLFVEWFETPSSSYTHGPLVAGLALWLVIRATHIVTPQPPAAGYRWLLVASIFASSLLWLIALRAGIQVGHQALLPLLLVLNVALVLGVRAARTSLVPVALLYSAIPVWHVILPLLQAMTIKVVGVMLRVAGVPAYVEGDFVYIRSGVFHVEDGCSGLHYFIVAATIAVLSGELRKDRWRERAQLLALAVALALVSNWVRVFIIIVVGHLTDMKHFLVRVDHGTFGWVVFAIAMSIFVVAVRRWRVGENSTLMPEGPCGARAWRATAVTGGLGLIASAGLPLWSLLAPVAAAQAPNVDMPAVANGWSGPVEPCRTNWKPQFASADWQRQSEYRRGEQTVCVYLASYLSQQQGKELIGYQQSIHGPGADVVAARVREFAGMRLNELQTGSRAGPDRLIWFAYAIGDISVRSDLAAQLAYSLKTFGQPGAASVYAISADCVPDCGAARELLANFLPQVLGTIRAGEGR